MKLMPELLIFGLEEFTIVWFGAKDGDFHVLLR